MSYTNLDHGLLYYRNLIKPYSHKWWHFENDQITTKIQLRKKDTRNIVKKNSVFIQQGLLFQQWTDMILSSVWTPIPQCSKWTKSMCFNSHTATVISKNSYISV
jgi:hypothetical protein